MENDKLRNTYIKVHVAFTAHQKSPVVLSQLLHEASLKTEDPALVDLHSRFRVEVMSLTKNKKGQPVLQSSFDKTGHTILTGRDCPLNAPYFRIVDQVVLHTEDILESDEPSWAAIARKDGWRPADEL